VNHEGHDDSSTAKNTMIFNHEDHEDHKDMKLVLSVHRELRGSTPRERRG
jgi:hypothetical protein